MALAVADSGGKVLLVLLSGDAGRAVEAIRAAKRTSEVETLRLSDLPGAMRSLLGHRRLHLAVAGAPPLDEIGYGLAPLIALAMRAGQISLIDVRNGRVQSMPSLRYLVGALPFACSQLVASAIALGAQRALTQVEAVPSSAAGSSPELRRVLYLRPRVGSSSLVGGSITHAHEVIRALRAKGIELDAITTDDSIAEAARADPDPACLWRVTNTPRVLKALPASAGFGNDVALMRTALRRARSSDVIYQRHARFSIAGAVLSRATRTPLFLEYNSSEEFVGTYWNPTPMKKQLAACESAALAAAARILVVSEVSRRDLVARGVDPNRIVVNPNGVAPERFTQGGGTSVRRQHGLAEDDVVIGFVGTFGPWHGGPVLARAFCSIASQLPQVRLLLVGAGPELQGTREELVSRGLEGRAVVVGSVPSRDVPRYLDACDLLASPHVPLAGGVEFFGSPTKLFEYMAAGKAIVASELGQIADVLEHGRSGWLVQPGDAEALAGALAKLAMDPQLRAELGAAARNRVASYTWGGNADRIIDAYRSFAAGAR
jgi:glycosyltransferase involved in cell wall biosynthesis